MAFIPLSEGGSINNNNGVLDQSLGTNQLVVGRVIHNINDTGLAGTS